MCGQPSPWAAGTVTNKFTEHLRTMRAGPYLRNLMLALAAVSFIAALPVFAQQVVVVELFTSEGCSSCPPADALLGQLSKQRDTTSIELVLLGEHVEYWNGQGWNDRFSGAAFTQR